MLTKRISASRMLDDDGRTEALERLRYLAETGANGVLTGAAGTGKSTLFRQLSRELIRTGLPVCQMSLAGVSGTDLPALVAGQLGLGLPLAVSPQVVWSQLHDFSGSCRQTGARQVLLLEDVDRGDETLIRPLDRLLELFVDCGSCLFSSRTDPSPMLERFLNERTWLRIELGRLSRPAATQVVREATREQLTGRQVEPSGMEELIALSGGRLQRLHRLSALAGLAAETEEQPRIDRGFVKSVAEELGCA